MTIPQYLLESSFCLAVFYGFYHFFLKKETFFQLNRAYLLVTPIAALSIPLLNISFQKDAPPESLEALFYPAIQSAYNLNEVVWEQMRAPSPVFSLSIADVIMAIYLMGIFLMSFSLLKGLWNLGRIIRQGKRSKNNEFTLVETQNNFPAASFFGYIFWNQQITDEQQLILEHEKVHIRQWHSLDVLLIEFCVIIKWFNPLIYWFRNALKATHEFIADQYVIQQKSTIGEYATLLVSQHRQQVSTPLTNTFYSLTKKRLQMMLQRPSQKVYVLKYLFVFPLMIGLMGLFSFNLLDEIPTVREGIAEINTVLGDIADKTVFEIDKPSFEKEVESRTQALTKEAGNRILYWGELELNLHKQNGQPIPIVEVPINQFLASYHEEPIAALKIGGLFEEVSFFINNRSVLTPSNSSSCRILSNTNTPNIFKENECIKNLKDNLQIGNLINVFDLQIGKLNQRYEFIIRLIDPMIERPNPNGEFRFKWGKIEFPLVFKGMGQNSASYGKTVPLNDILTALNQPLSILDGNRPAKGIHNIVLHFGELIPINGRESIFKDFKSNVPQKIKLMGNEKNIGDQVDLTSLMELINTRTHITFYVNGFDFAGFITVDDGKYRSPIHVKKDQHELFNFQIIIPDDAKTILRTDTSLSENKTIVRMYSNSEKYEIIHIPNFKTANRSIVGNPINTYSSDKLRKIPSPFFKTKNEAIADDKLIQLPEYVDYQPTELKLQWGELLANPTSENYDLLTFLGNYKEGLQLIHSNKNITIQKLRMIIAKKDEAYEIYDGHLPDLKDLQKVLGQLSTETSIYFDKLIIKTNGQTYYLPQQFLFKIGKLAIAKGEFVNNSKKDIRLVKSNSKPKQSPINNDFSKVNHVKSDSSDINTFNIFPFTYSNQIVIRKEKMKNPDGSYRIAYTQKMEDYEKIEARRIDGEAAIAEFGEAGRKGISYVVFQHKKRKKRTNVDKENNPLYIYYVHPYFPMITHKLVYDNLEAKDIASIKKFPPNSREARFYGGLGKNGVVEVRFNYPFWNSKPDKEPIKVTIKKANPKWSNSIWMHRNSMHTVYLMKNIPLSKAFKLLKKLPANQIDITNLKEDFPIHVSIHGGLEVEHNESWVLSKIQEEFQLKVIEKQEKRKVLILKKGKVTSLDDYEYFIKSLPNIKNIIKSNQANGLKTISPGYFKDYRQLVRDNFELPLIDETGLFGEKAICLGIDPASIEIMQKTLRENYGLELVKEERIISVYELRQ